MQVIKAKLLIPGDGLPIEQGCVVLDGPLISYAGPAAAAPAYPATAEVHELPAVMPGMWDCHVHLFGLKSTQPLQHLGLHPAVAAARAVKDLEAALAAGFTSVREMGGLGVYLAQVVSEGTIAGPAIYAAGAMLSQTGGHGDVHSAPLSWVHDTMRRESSCMHLCDGVAECLRAVRSQLRLGAKLIKIHASGGVLSEIDDPQHQQLSAEELRAIVAEAARADRIVAAHCHGKAPIMACLRAGVHTIEHGTYLDEEAALLMKEQGAVLVPTRLITERILELGEGLGLPAFALAKMRAMAGRGLAATRLASAAGVTIALGTDTYSSGPETISPWGLHGRELGYLVEAGMTPLEAIAVATKNGPLTLGPQAPKSGVLAAGYQADVLGLGADPLADISILADPEQIRQVWQAGRLVKGGAPSRRRRLDSD